MPLLRLYKGNDATTRGILPTGEKTRSHDDTTVCNPLRRHDSLQPSTATLGANCVRHSNVSVQEHVQIGNNVIATAQTGIPCSVKDNQLISGYPAIANRTWLKGSAVSTRPSRTVLRELQSLQARVEELEKQKQNGD